MQRIFKYDDIQNASLSSDKEMNIVMYWTFFYFIIYRSYTFLKVIRFCSLL